MQVCWSRLPDCIFCIEALWAVFANHVCLCSSKKQYKELAALCSCLSEAHVMGIRFNAFTFHHSFLTKCMPRLNLSYKLIHAIFSQWVSWTTMTHKYLFAGGRLVLVCVLVQDWTFLFCSDMVHCQYIHLVHFWMFFKFLAYFSQSKTIRIFWLSIYVL